MKKIFITALFAAAAMTACGPKKAEGDAQKQETATPQKPVAGTWRGTLGINEGLQLPFNFSLEEEAGAFKMTLLNADEKLKIGDAIRTEGDSMRLQMGIFDTELIFALANDGTLNGRWARNDGRTYSMPFQAKPATYRFKEQPSKPGFDMSGRWETDFKNDDGSIEKAVGLFTQEGSKLTGTFLTTTGDYRFLEGCIDGTELNLSCFDGTHAYLFKANVIDQNILGNGRIWSGSHYSQEWTAKRNDNFKLPDANTLTYLKKGFDKIEFSFPDLDGNKVGPEDPAYQGKVRVIQLLGSWCPNCMDETAFLAPFHKKYQEKGFEVIGLAYEASPEFEKAKARVEKMKKQMDVGYTVLIAGVANKKAASESLPMLNQVLSFPTTIFLDKKGKVRKIHTGFSGPGTGAEYTRLTEEFQVFIDKLLAE
jgi:thiol-disulfide isomerase/thioredoxin